MISVEEHLADVLRAVRPLASEQVPVLEAAGRVLAADVRAVVPVPPFTNSAMDGFAVRAADAAAGARLPVTGDIPAGAPFPPALLPGTAQRVMTGAPIPASADAVVQVEHTDQPRGVAPLPDAVGIVTAPAPGRHIRRQGEDVATGDLVLTAGEWLTPAAVASAISVGHGTLPCARRPRIAVISTGSELRAPGSTLADGQIPDSNGPLLALLAERAGARIVLTRRTSDDPAEFARVLGEARALADVVVTSGGASVGAFDVVREVTEPLGVDFREVAMQPGKPQGVGGSPRLLALPGNPVSVFVSFHLFVLPLLAALQGAAHSAPVVHARAVTGWRCPPRRRQYSPVRVRFGESVECEQVHLLGSGSHLIASLHRANGLAIAGEDAGSVGDGEVVPVMLL